jgi:hypothetical protein
MTIKSVSAVPALQEELIDEKDQKLKLAHCVEFL